jgi:hypothetical protein
LNASIIPLNEIEPEEREPLVEFLKEKKNEKGKKKDVESI